MSSALLTLSGVTAYYGSIKALKGIDLSVDKGEIVTLKQGDVMIQRGTNHAWINRYEDTCRMAFVLIDAVPLGFTEHLRSRENEHAQLAHGARS